MANPFKNFDLQIDSERTALLSCIGIAILIWFFLKLSKEYESDTHIHLEYTLPSMMEFTESPPTSVVATLHGTGFQLLKKYLFERRPTVTIDLSQALKSEVQRSFLVWKIQEETGLAVQNISLDYLNFSIDSTATKKVPVDLDLEVVFERDFFEKQPIKLSHDSVTLAGPIKELQHISTIKTERTVIEKVNSDMVKTIQFSREGLNRVNVFPEKIEVEIFAEQFTEKSFNVPVRVVDAPADFQIMPTSVNVSCAVGLSKFELLEADSFIVEVDLGEAIKLGEDKSVPVTLKGSPPWIKSPRISPKVVEYIIIK